MIDQRANGPSPVRSSARDKITRLVTASQVTSSEQSGRRTGTLPEGSEAPELSGIPAP